MLYFIVLFLANNYVKCDSLCVKEEYESYKICNQNKCSDCICDDNINYLDSLNNKSVIKKCNCKRKEYSPFSHLVTTKDESGKVSVGNKCFCDKEIKKQNAINIRKVDLMLLNAVENNNVDLVKLLLKSNANPNIIISENNSYQFNHLAFTEDELNPNYQNKYISNLNLLGIAIKNNNIEIIKLLVNNGYSFDLNKDTDMFSIIVLCAVYNRLNVLKYIFKELKIYYQLNEKEVDTAVFFSIKENNYDIFNFLIEEFSQKVNFDMIWIKSENNQYIKTLMIIELLKNKKYAIVKQLILSKRFNFKHNNYNFVARNHFNDKNTTFIDYIKSLKDKNALELISNEFK